MDHNIYKTVTLTGTSPDSVDDAIKRGVERAGKTLRNLGWFKVTEIRGALSDGGVSEFQVTMDVGFTLDEGK